jgi:carbonic anhydrase/acetyltransferase-like protein (isoleucine patch superfamily)
MSIVDYGEKKPRVDGSVLVAPGSFVIGDVIIKEGSGIWNGAVIRGDDDSVEIGARVTVLEKKIGDGAIVSHGAIVHGATIGDNALVGIGAIVLDGGTVGEGSIIGAGAVVPPRAVIPPNTLALGIPAKGVREVRDGEMEFVAKERQRLTSKVEKYKMIFAK